MPWDCDINIHLTNGRYPQRLDHARTRFFYKLAQGLLFAHKGWRSVLASQTPSLSAKLSLLLWWISKAVCCIGMKNIFIWSIAFWLKGVCMPNALRVLQY